MGSANNDRTIYQPIHPSIRHLLDPEYVAFHDKYLQYVIPDDQKIWDGSARLPSPLWPSTALVLPEQIKSTASIHDIWLKNFYLRIFRPVDEMTIYGNRRRPTSDGRSSCGSMEGDGQLDLSLAIGSIADNNDLCTIICHVAKCIVVSVGYRLAPEHPYPVPVEDAVEALQWIYSAEGAQVLQIDNTRIAIGGLSAGGNLAAVLSLKAASLTPAPIPIAFQILIMPVIDNTATVHTIWAANKHAPWLTPERMTWYRSMYLPNGQWYVRNWDVSPNLAPKELLAKSPKTWIAVAEHDLLAPEAIAYTTSLKDAWDSHGSQMDVGVTVKEYRGSTHSLLVMGGVLAKGRTLINDVAEQV